LRYKKNRDINIVNLSFIDLLTGALGAIALILFYYVIVSQNVSNEKFAEVEILTEKVPDIHISNFINFSFSAKGGLEPYRWSFCKPETEKCSPNSIVDNPPLLKINQNSGILTTHNVNISYEPNSLKGEIFPISYCFGVKVKAVGYKEHDEFNKYLKQLLANNPKGISTDKIIIQHFETTKTFNLKIQPPQKNIPPIAKALILPPSIENKRYEYSFVPLYGNFNLSKNINYNWGLKIKSFINDRGETNLENKPILSNKGIFVWEKPKKGTLNFEVALADDFNSINFLSDTDTISNEQSFRLKVVDLNNSMIEYKPPQIITKKLITGYRFEKYFFQLAVLHGLPPYKWEIEGIDQIQGLKFDEDTGCIYGTPKIQFNIGQTEETFNFKVIASDKKKVTSSKTFKLIIKNRRVSLDPLFITTTQDEINKIELYKGKYTEILLNSHGGLDDKEWRIEFEPQKTGISYQDNIIKGIPQVIGNVKINVIVSDSIEKHRKEFILKIKPQKLIIKTIEINDAIKEKYYEQTFIGEGGMLPYVWTISLDPSTTWYNQKKMDNHTYQLNGTPTKVENYKVKIELHDNSNQKDQKTFNLQVHNKLQIMTKVLKECILGQLCYQRIKADGGLRPYKWRIDFPAHLEWLDQGQLYKGIIYGIPNTTGNYEISVKLSDSTSSNVYKDFDLSISRQSIVPQDIVGKQPTGNTGSGLSGFGNGTIVPEGFHLPDGYIFFYYEYSFRDQLNIINIKNNNLPKDLNIENQYNTWKLRGIPFKSGEYNFSLEIESYTKKEAREYIIEIKPFYYSPTVQFILVFIIIIFLILFKHKREYS